jgi:SAM-dependent methyltransferase
MPETIYQRPADYELEHEGDRDVAFYQQLTSRLRPGRVLELACGNGRLTVPLAEALPANAAIVGVELNEHMLADAQRKRRDSHARASLRFEPGDMRTWRSNAPFDLVLIGCSSITHLLTLDERLAVWRAAFGHLVPGGRFVIDITMPDLGACADSQRTPPRAFTTVDLDQTDPETGARLVRQRTFRYDTLTQRADIQFLYDKFEDQRHASRYISDFPSHVYFPQELTLLFLVAGFTVESIWGDYRFRPATSRSHEIVMIGVRP